MATKRKKTKLKRRYGHAARPARSGLQAFADETATAVISEATREAIAKIAEEFIREVHKDPAYRAEIRREALEAAKKVVESLRASRGEP
jgi:hypothetical protein